MAIINYTSNSCYALTGAINLVPAPTAITGAIDVTGGNNQVGGVGTLFESEVAVGDILYIVDGNQWRRVKSIVSDILLVVDDAWESDAVAGTPMVLKKSDQNIRSIVVKAKGNGVVVITDTTETLLQDEVVSFDKSQHEGSGKFSFVDPIVVDATVDDARITLMKY